MVESLNFESIGSSSPVVPSQDSVGRGNPSPTTGEATRTPENGLFTGLRTFTNRLAANPSGCAGSLRVNASFSAGRPLSAALSAASPASFPLATPATPIPLKGSRVPVALPHVSHPRETLTQKQHSAMDEWERLPSVQKYARAKSLLYDRHIPDAGELTYHDQQVLQQFIAAYDRDLQLLLQAMTASTHLQNSLGEGMSHSAK